MANSPNVRNGGSAAACDHCEAMRERMEVPRVVCQHRVVALCEARIAQLEGAVRLARDYFVREDFAAMVDAMNDALDPTELFDGD